MASDPTRPATRWHLWIDTGGTFSDCLATDPSGRLIRAKVLSSGQVRGAVSRIEGGTSVFLQADWDLPDDFFRGARARGLGTSGEGSVIEAYRAADRCLRLARSPDSVWEGSEACEISSGLEAPVLAAHWVTRTPLTEELPPLSMRLATTRGTNALLERDGSPPALFITRGFADLLEIGTQQRPEIFSLVVEKPQPLYSRVVEVDERLDHEGNVLVELDVESVRGEALAMLASGTSVAAVALLHSYRNPRHEQRLARFLLDLGFHHVSGSAALAPLIKVVPRAETAVVNAYLCGVIEGYLSAIRTAIEPGQLHVLTSSGSLVGSHDYLPKDSLLSGPAGGVVGAAASAAASGFPRSLAFDMGGTSTDVSRWDGNLEYRFETRVGDAHLLSPSLAIETVAAGGGSICSFDGRQLKVGPASAGADPGPACYGAGGPLTLTDVNLLLGRLDPRSFEIPVDVSAARDVAERLLVAVQQASGSRPGLEAILSGALEIANERMAEAVRRISIRQGYRPSQYALVAFGGAGGQHACAIAEILGISTILVPEDAGLLSAMGLGRARIERISARQVLQPLAVVTAKLNAWMTDLEAEARSRVIREGVEERDVEIRRRLVHLRLQGQEATLTVEMDSADNLGRLFAEAYRDHFGYLPSDRRIEVESLHAIAAARQPPLVASQAGRRQQAARPMATRSAYLGGRWQQVWIYRRESLDTGGRLAGPALIFERHCATVVESGWQVEVDCRRCLILRRSGSAVGEEKQVAKE